MVQVIFSRLLIVYFYLLQPEAHWSLDDIITKKKRSSLTSRWICGSWPSARDDVNDIDGLQHELGIENDGYRRSVLGNRVWKRLETG